MEFFLEKNNDESWIGGARLFHLTFASAEPQALRLYVSVSVTCPICRAAMFAAQTDIKFLNESVVIGGNKICFCYVRLFITVSTSESGMLSWAAIWSGVAPKEANIFIDAAN